MRISQRDINMLCKHINYKMKNQEISTTMHNGRLEIRVYWGDNESTLLFGGLSTREALLYLNGVYDSLTYL